METSENQKWRKGGFPVLARSSSQLAASDAWALSSNHNAKQLILIRCKHSRRLENRLNAHWVGLVKKLRAPDSLGLPSATAYRPDNVKKCRLRINEKMQN
jgi:hypothetical protein